MSPTDDTNTTTYRRLYWLGGIAAFAVAFLTAAEIIVFILFPPPGTIREWFSLFQTHPLVGLLDFWGLEYLMYAMFVFVFLALYFILRENDRSRMAIALTLALLGIAIFYATSNPFSMLTLSRQYATAATDMDKSALLASGEVLLAFTNQRAIGGFNMGLFLISIAGLLTSTTMRTSISFRKSTTTIGMIAFTLSLADYIRQVFTSSLTIALPIILLGAVFLVIWFVAVGRTLLQIGNHEE